MNQSSDMLMTVLTFIFGSGSMALLNIIIDYFKYKRKDQSKNIDDRIVAWQKITEKTESRIGFLEKKIESYEKNFKLLELHVTKLEHTILKIRPSIELPERPNLE